MGWTTPGVFEHSHSSTILSLIPRIECLVYLPDGILQRSFTSLFLIVLARPTLVSRLVFGFRTSCHNIFRFSKYHVVCILSFLITLIVYLVWILTFSSVSTINREKFKPVATASLLIPFLPASNLLFWVGFVIAERVMYLPSIGSCVLFGTTFTFSSLFPLLFVHVNITTSKTVIHVISSNIKKLKYVVTLCGLVFLLASLRHTILRNNAWRDSETLYKEDMDVNPLNAKIPYGLARVYINRDRDEDAEKALIRSLHIEPKFGVALAWLGRVYVRRMLVRDIFSSLTYSRVSLFHNRYDSSTRTMRRTWRHLKGLHLLRKAIENSPDEFDAHIYLADTLIRSDSLAQTSLYEATRVLFVRPRFDHTQCKTVSVLGTYSTSFG